MPNDEANNHFSRLREIPRAIWALGFVSLLMDASSEIIHALLPIYLVTVLALQLLFCFEVRALGGGLVSSTPE